MPLPMRLDMMFTHANKMVWIDNKSIGLFCIPLLQNAMAQLYGRQGNLCFREAIDAPNSGYKKNRKLKTAFVNSCPELIPMIRIDLITG